MGIFSATAESPETGNGKPLSGEQASRITAAGESVKSKNLGGRPRKDGQPNKSGVISAGVAKPVAGNPQQPETPVSEADIEFARTVADAGLKILARVERNMVIGMIDAIGDSYVSEKKDAYLRRFEIGEGDVEIVTNAVGAIAAKYSVLVRYAPEAALVSWAAIHAMSFQGTVADLKRLAVEIKAVKGTPVDASPPQTN